MLSQKINTTHGKLFCRNCPGVRFSSRSKWNLTLSMNYSAVSVFCCLDPPNFFSPVAADPSNDESSSSPWLRWMTYFFLKSPPSTLCLFFSLFLSRSSSLNLIFPQLNRTPIPCGGNFDSSAENDNFLSPFSWGVKEIWKYFFCLHHYRIYAPTYIRYTW